MRIKQISIYTAYMASGNSQFHGTSQQFMRAVAVMQTCPEVQFPCFAPPGSFIAACIQRHFHGICIFIVLFASSDYNLRTRMQPEKMIRMPVSAISGNILRHFIFPFHKLPAQTDFRSGEFAHSCCYLCDFRVFVPSQFFAGFDHHVEHFTNHSLRS